MVRLGMCVKVIAATWQPLGNLARLAGGTKVSGQEGSSAEYHTFSDP